jgi:lipid-binding SYLF domain-containing protein
MLGSARFGSGIVIARLDNDSWSAPSAISLAGVGFGGQFGFELTDFVFILDEAGLRSLMRMGSLTLGANISIAFGPVGRNAEFTSSANTSGISMMFAYSKTKGLFGGVSVEGGLLVERRFANKKLYNCKVTASQLLSGEIPAPPEVEPILRILQSDRFQRKATMPLVESAPRSLEPAAQGFELPTRADNQPPAELPSEGVQPNACQSPAEVHAESSVVLPTELPAETIIQTPAEPTGTYTNGARDYQPRDQVQTPAEIEIESHGALPSETKASESRSEPGSGTPRKLKAPLIVEPSVPHVLPQTV